MAEPEKLEDIIILRALPRPTDDPVDFGQFCRQLGASKPKRGDGPAWALLFKTIEELEAQGLFDLKRDGRQINSIRLSHAGLARFQALKEQRSQKMTSV